MLKQLLLQQSGSTARTISKYRPHSDIIAVTPSEETARQCAIVWGVNPVVKEGRKTLMHYLITQ